MPKDRKAKGVVLVTGGSKRIGRAICLSLAASGYTIALHYNKSHTQAQKLADTIKKKGGRCETFACDLSDQNQVAALVPNVKRKFSRLDIIINNASLFKPSTIKAASFKSVNRHFAVNFNAPFVLISQFAQKCKKGHVINILDTHIVDNKTKYAAYLLSKKALAELTKMAAVELAPQIRVNAVAPGLILPPKGKKSNYLDRLAKQIPLKKKGNVDQITQSIAFLINNPYLTGQIIFNDGGEHLI